MLTGRLYMIAGIHNACGSGLPLIESSMNFIGVCSKRTRGML
jgi:hypothetical protein